MRSQINRDLLLDLARLAKRYTPEDWESIIQWLQDETRRAQLIALIQELSGISKQLSSKMREKRKLPEIPRLLEEIGHTNPQKAELLQEFWRKLRSREILPTLSTLRIFVETAGLRSITTKKHQQAVNELMRQLVDLPQEDIQNALEKTSVASRDFGEEYERWVALILGRRRGEPTLNR